MPTNLYGTRRPKFEASKKDLSSSSNLAFTTHLSSLISKDSKTPSSTVDSDSTTTRARHRPSKTKKDIFSVHNKGAQKRAAADVSADASSNGVFQTHKRAADIGTVDDAVLHRSKRKMMEKAKLYTDLKKGEYLAEAGSSSDEDDGRDSADKAYSAVRRAEKNSLVDFDRKWAEHEARNEDADENEDNDGDNDDTLVDYEDEFGRTRQGTKAEAAEAAVARRRVDQENQPSLHEQQEEEYGYGYGYEAEKATRVPEAARPSRPSNLIYGSTVQAAAFNPDTNIATQMSNLAKRRDRTPTPPPETHYDADGEIRTRGTGFYAFSKDEEARKREMDDLSRARGETLRERSQAATKKEAREKAKQDRRKKIEELRGKRRAEQFLSGLGGTLDITGGDGVSEAKTKEAD